MNARSKELDCPLYLESTFEPDTLPLCRLINALLDARGVCFDAGRWFSFADEQRKANLAYWIGTLGSRINHLYLHDNDGTTDQHKGIGAGFIPWDALYHHLIAVGSTPLLMLEPHDIQSFETVITWLTNHSSWIDFSFF